MEIVIATVAAQERMITAVERGTMRAMDTMIHAANEDNDHRP